SAIAHPGWVQLTQPAGPGRRRLGDALPPSPGGARWVRRQLLAKALASHGSGNGIYRNVVAHNVSHHNCAAGVGIFGSIPGTSTHDNVVIGNTVTDNGEAGVAFHIYGPGVTLDNNMNGGSHLRAAGERCFQSD